MKKGKSIYAPRVLRRLRPLYACHPLSDIDLNQDGWIDGIIPLFPCGEAAGKRTHPLDAAFFEEQRHTGAGSFVGSSAVQDHVAVAGNEIVLVLQFLRRDPQGAHNGMRRAFKIKRMAQVDDENVIAGIHHLL